MYWETFGFDSALYAGYRLLSPAGDTLRFVGAPRIPNRDYVATVGTPQWSKLDLNLLYVGGQDENFFEWAQANIDYVSLTCSPINPTRARCCFSGMGAWRMGCRIRRSDSPGSRSAEHRTMYS